MKAKKLIEIEDQYGAHNYHPLDIVIKKAEGVWVEDVEGNRFMDFLAAYSAVNQGHCHPRLLKALRRQAAKVTLTSRAFRNDQLPYFCQEVCELTGYDKVLPMNSGAEAVETAIKAARKWGEKVKGIKKDKAEIIVCADNFHGRTTTIVGFSTEDQYKDGFGPFTPGFKVIPFGDAKALEAAITKNTAAFMVEPIQGEAGINVPPKGFLKKAAALCKQEQRAVHRRRDPVGPGPHRQDVRLRARGRPARRRDHRQGPQRRLLPRVGLPGQRRGHGRLQARRPRLDLRRQSAGHGRGPRGPEGAGRGEAGREQRQAGSLVHGRSCGKMKFKSIKKVRGQGLWIGLVLDRPARPYCEALMNEGMLCKETHENVIRFAPPLTISKKELNMALRRINKVFKKLG